MSNNYGSGVSRVLDPTGTQYLDVIWQQGKPPLDSELNLSQDITADWRRKIVLRGTPSGWLGNETNTSTDFITASNWSNWWRFGRQRTGEVSAVMWAVVNGWLVPITGTRTGTPPGSPDDVDTWNVIAMDPPPSNSGDTRVDFVFLEVWLARVPPNPSNLNKPSVSAVYRYGNVEGGYSFIADDTVDPALGFETTERVQLQYRIRVAKGLVGLTTNPDGFDPTVVFGQGASSASTSFTFTNMRKALGDPGLWRAGDGTQNSLGTVDGYTYAIPLAGVFRRNAVSWAGDPSPNLNGAYNRNPSAVDRTNIQTFVTSVTLSTALSATATSATLSTATNIPLPATPATPVLLKIGDEYLTYAAITGTTLGTLTRGVNGTRAEPHPSGAPIQVISTRPDGLFADQVASTDLLDLRHVVNPNGFSYEALLKGNLDKLLRGELRANWKRSGAGPQGTFVHYQDKLSQSNPALGVTKLDGPDGIRMIFSDAAVIQKIETAIIPTSNAPPASISGTGYSLAIPATQTVQASSGKFSANDVIKFPVSALQSTVGGGDIDQVRWISSVESPGLPTAVVLRIDGQTDPVPTSLYTVSGGGVPGTDLTVTLGASFPQTTSQIYVRLHALYGAGRGLARRPNSIHNLSLISPSTELLVNPVGVPSNNFPLKTGWARLWSRYQKTAFRNNLPVTAQAYADLGSKTIVITPFQRIVWPTSFTTIDGSAANVSTGSPIITSTQGSASGSTTFTDTSGPSFTGTAGKALIVTTGPQPGRYNIVSVTSSTAVVLDRAIPTATGMTYTVQSAQGLMPLLASDGSTTKWTTTDPLGMFSGTTDSVASRKNIYVSLPITMVPNWGAVYVPILHAGSTGPTFAEGINFMLLSNTGTSPAVGDTNYVNYAGTGGLTWAVMTTQNFGVSPPVASTYNAAVSLPGGLTAAGMRFFTDSLGLGRQGLEMPPFYGIARLFAVYEAGDYKVNGSAYNATDRTPRGSGATNLLRQDVSTATFWITSDVDGDSTFVLNADCIDVTKSTVNPIANFASGNYVIEVSAFGFDRGSFITSETSEFRLVLSQARTQAISGTRASNIGAGISGPTSVLPGPATPSDTILINYSRTPYQGDPWGSQSSYIDSSQQLGPIQTASAFQVASTRLTQSSLTRPNQKALEVLASVGFATTLGTGRLSGGGPLPTKMDFLNVGYEDPSQYPPTSGGQARPTVLVGANESGVPDVATQYLGASERLPLGALWRDKDFRGGSLGLANGDQAALVYLDEKGQGVSRSNLTSNTQYEQSEIPLDTASLGSATPGDLVAQVDGEAVNYSLLVNYRVNRGGSLFMMNGSHPGGEISVDHPVVEAPLSHTNVIQGRAMLVRNAVTNTGANEVSAGDEIMLLITTNVMQLKDGSPHPGFVFIGTNGSNEGYAASDLYRIEGHPLTNDNVRLDTDPATITLSMRST